MEEHKLHTSFAFCLLPTLVRILQRNRANRKRFMARNWLMQLWKQASPKSAWWSAVRRPMEEPMLQFKSKCRLLADSLLHFGSSVFCSSLSFSWLDEAHPQYGGQPVYLKFTTEVFISLKKNTLIESTSKSEHIDPAKLAHKINHQNPFLSFSPVVSHKRV